MIMISDFDISMTSPGVGRYSRKCICSFHLREYFDGRAAFSINAGNKITFARSSALGPEGTCFQSRQDNLFKRIASYKRERLASFGIEMARPYYFMAPAWPNSVLLQSSTAARRSLFIFAVGNINGDAQRRKSIMPAHAPSASNLARINQSCRLMLPLK